MSTLWTLPAPYCPTHRVTSSLTLRPLPLLQVPDLTPHTAPLPLMQVPDRVFGGQARE